MFRSFLVIVGMSTLLTFLPSAPHSQLPNPGFESWSAGEPDSWFTTNHPEINPSTTISFELPEVSDVSLNVYTLAGEEVAVLADGVRQPGTYRVRFDGSGLPSGVYFYRLTAGAFNAGGKMMLLK